MTIFFLQRGIPESAEFSPAWCRVSRVFLDSHMHLGCAVEQRVSAKDWKAARREVDKPL